MEYTSSLVFNNSMNKKLLFWEKQICKLLFFGNYRWFVILSQVNVDKNDRTVSQKFKNLILENLEHTTLQNQGDDIKYTCTSK